MAASMMPHTGSTNRTSTISSSIGPRTIAPQATPRLPRGSRRLLPGRSCTRSSGGALHMDPGSAAAHPGPGRYASGPPYWCHALDGGLGRAAGSTAPPARCVSGLSSAAQYDAPGLSTGLAHKRATWLLPQTAPAVGIEATLRRHPRHRVVWVGRGRQGHAMSGWNKATRASASLRFHASVSRLTMSLTATVASGSIRPAWPAEGGRAGDFGQLAELLALLDRAVGLGQPPVGQGRDTPIMASRVTMAASSSSVAVSVPAGRSGSTR
jgi:hypothetical protein